MGISKQITEVTAEKHDVAVVKSGNRVRAYDPQSWDLICDVGDDEKHTESFKRKVKRYREANPAAEKAEPERKTTRGAETRRHVHSQQDPPHPEILGELTVYDMIEMSSLFYFNTCLFRKTVKPGGLLKALTDGYDAGPKAFGRVAFRPREDTRVYPVREGVTEEQATRYLQSLHCDNVEYDPEDYEPEKT